MRPEIKEIIWGGTKMREKYNAMIHETEAVICNLEAERRKTLSNTASTDWMTVFSKFKDISQLSREAVVTLIDRIYIFENKHIKIDF